MAKFPGAVWKPLPENATQPKITPTQLIFHTAVDAPGPTNLWAYFNGTSVVVESHFWIPLGGASEQFVDTNVQADANYKANVRAISAETEDEGNPEGTPWTPAQLSAMRDLALWAHAVHGIPLVPCPAWDAPGIGYHSMFGFSDNRALTGVLDNPWTTAKGKTCPGKTRVAQFWDVFIPSLAQGQTMDQATAETAVKVVYRALLNRDPDPAGLAYWAGMLVGGMSREVFLWTFMEAAAPEIGSARADVAALKVIVNDLSNKVAVLQATQTPGASVDAVVAAIASKLAK